MFFPPFSCISECLGSQSFADIMSKSYMCVLMTSQQHFPVAHITDWNNLTFIAFEMSKIQTK